MPVRETPLTATIGFTLPQFRLDHDEAIYLTWKQGQSKPLEQVEVPIINLRSELDSDDPVDPLEQLKKRGYAVTRHASEHLGAINTETGIAEYMNETAALLKQIMGADEVIAWNSVCRSAQTDVQEVIVPKQQGPEVKQVPTSKVQPPAGTAHVDQTARWGRELCGKAAGKDAGEYSRCQIINLWRPLHGPVTNRPLAMLDPRTLGPDDLGTHASQFGQGHDLHYSTSQRWAYIRHQMPDEAILLKCFDTDQGESGEVLYCGHAAVEVAHDADGIAPELVRPRESIEVRLVALWH